MNSYNRVIILGNLVHDPVLKTVGEGVGIVTVSIAINEPKKAKSGAWTEEVHYFDVTLFGKLAENMAKYKRKGDPVLIEGKLHQSRWDTPEGQKRQKVGIVATSVQFIPRGGAKNNAGEVPHNVGQVFPDAQPVDDGEIPF